MPEILEDWKVKPNCDLEDCISTCTDVPQTDEGLLSHTPSEVEWKKLK